MAAWIPVTVVPTSLATVAIDTFMTELSSVIKNCAEASVSSTAPAAPAAPSAAAGPISVSRLASMRPARSRSRNHQAHIIARDGPAVGPGGKQSPRAPAHDGPLWALAPRLRTQRSEEHTSELQSRENLVCRLLLEKKKKKIKTDKNLKKKKIKKKQKKKKKKK